MNMFDKFYELKLFRSLETDYHEYSKLGLALCRNLTETLNLQPMLDLSDLILRRNENGDRLVSTTSTDTCTRPNSTGNRGGSTLPGKQVGCLKTLLCNDKSNEAVSFVNTTLDGVTYLR